MIKEISNNVESNYVYKGLKSLQDGESSYHYQDSYRAFFFLTESGKLFAMRSDNFESFEFPKIHSSIKKISHFAVAPKYCDQMLVVSNEGKLFDIISSDFARDWGYTPR